MKRKVIITAAIAAVIGICSVGYCAEGDIVEGVLKDLKIVINGNELETEDSLVIINNRTYLPLRTIAEGMGAEVEYDDEDGQIYVTKDVSYPGDDWEESTYTDDDGHIKICFRAPNGEIMLKTDYIDPWETQGVSANWRTWNYGKYGAFVNYRYFTEGVVVFIKHTSTVQTCAGYMDVYGNETVFDLNIKGISPYGDGLAAVTTQEGSSVKYGFINRMGEMVISEQYESVGRFSEGVCMVYENKNDVGYFIDKNGEKIFGDRKMSWASSFSDGYCLIKSIGWVTWTPEEKYTYIDHTGKRATEFDWDEATSFKNGYATVRDGNVWMKINKNFEVVEYLN